VIGKIQLRIQLRRPKHDGDNIKVDFKEIGSEGVGWLHLAQDWDKWWIPYKPAGCVTCVLKRHPKRQAPLDSNFCGLPLFVQANAEVVHFIHNNIHSYSAISLHAMIIPLLNAI
jgi:hypothetical protein